MSSGGQIRAGPEKQARDAVIAIQRDHDQRSETFGQATRRSTEQTLRDPARYGREVLHLRGGLQTMTADQANDYLRQRAGNVGQKMMDAHRQALQRMLYVTGGLERRGKLSIVRSVDPAAHARLAHKSRAYTPRQAQAIADRLALHNALAVRIAYAAGLRVSELYTIRPVAEQPADVRTNRPDAFRDKFTGRDGERYTVVGKGGLIREVMIPRELAVQLEARRLNTPQTHRDRGIRYEQRYRVGAGDSLRVAFARASKRELGWNRGAHGLRHSYAQERMRELQTGGNAYAHALAVVSQELGHFRPEITEVYLR